MTRAIQNVGSARALLVAFLLSLWFAVPAFAQERVMKETQVTLTSSSIKNPDRIDFTGKAVVLSRLARDPEAGRDSLVLLIDLNGVAAVHPKTKRSVTLTAQESLHVRNVANHTIEFPFTIEFDKNANLSVSRLGVARLSLNVDVATGTITSAVADLAAQ